MSTTGPRASCVYIFSSVVLTKEEREEAHWDGFFAKHTQVNPRIAEHIERRSVFIGVEPEWQKGKSKRNLEHAVNLSDAALGNLFQGEHKGACYLDAILLYPEKPPVFVVLVWNTPLASVALRQIPGVKIGSTPKSAKPWWKFWQ